MSNYSKTSPYAITPIVNEDYLDILQPRPVPITQYDLPYTIEAQFHQRPDIASHVLYGTPKLWWVFAARNPNQLGPDPYFNFTAGITIFVPRLDTLRRVLGI